MQRILLLVFAVLVFATTAPALAQQDPPPQEQSPPPQQPQPEPEPQAPPFERPGVGIEQPTGFNRERSPEMDRLDQERNRQILDSLGVDPTASSRTGRRTIQPHFAPVMRHDAEFDLQSIPLVEWLSAKDAAQIPWKIEVKSPDVRMDQRLEIAYMARIPAKQLNKLANVHELFFIIGVNGADGKWLVEPKVVHQAVKSELPNDIELWFSDWIFTQPGNYVLWFVLYDRETEKHNVAKRPVKVSQLNNDPFPNMTERLPAIELPRFSDREGGTVLGVYGGLHLPVENKRDIHVDLLSVLSPPEQWAGQKEIVRSHNEQTVAAVNTLSQMRLASGSISITGLDVTRREMPFQLGDSRQLDWTNFAAALHESTNTQTVSTETLLGNKTGGAFFRNSVNQILADSVEPMRVLIVITSSLRFERGSDLQPLKLQGDCRCRVYHLRFRHSVNDVFDDIEKLLKPLRPKTFNLVTAEDLRKALAGIIRDLEQL